MDTKLTGKLALEKMEFFSFHGFYEEERKTGGWYVVDVFIEFPVESDEKFESLERDTINYESIYEIVKDEMNHPRQLIETVVKSIGDRVLFGSPFVASLTVKLQKKNLPLQGKVGCSSFELNYRNK